MDPFADAPAAVVAAAVDDAPAAVVAAAVDDADVTTHDALTAASDRCPDCDDPTADALSDDDPTAVTDY